MKQQLIKIGAVLMTMVVLLSTMSFTIHQRYCSGNLVDTTVFSKSKSCKIIVKSDCCEITEECCDHEQIVIDGQKELPSRITVDLPINTQYFVFNSSNLFLDDCSFKSKKTVLNKEYVPPSLVFNKQVNHQVFII